MEDYDLDLSTGGFEFDEKEIIARLYETVTVSTITIATSEPQRRSISFDPKVTVHHVLSLGDYTDEEFAASWLNLDEMDRIRDSALNDAMLLDAGVEAKSITSRGLESRRKEGYQAKRRNRANGSAAVFFEIDSQEQTQSFSETKIANAYSFYSKPCAKIAHTIGKEDALEAMRIYNEDDNSASNSSASNSASNSSVSNSISISSCLSGSTGGSSSSRSKSSSSKRSHSNNINLESHFRKTKRGGFRKRLVTLAPRNRLASSAA